MSKIWITKGSKRAVEVLKGVINPPTPYADLIEAYYANAYHAGCVDVKAINILGNGLKDAGLSKTLSDMCIDSSLFMVLEKTIRDLVLFGNAFWETPKGEIYHVPAWTMYRTDKGWQQVVGKEKVNYAEDEIWHFRTDSLQSSYYGSPGYLSILPAIELMGTITSYNKNFFKNNAIPDFAIVTEGGVLSPAVEQNIQRFLRNKFQGYENAHKTLYLPVPEGMKVKFEFLQGQGTKDMRFQELANSCIAEIIACHGVPPRLLGIQVPGKLGGGGETTGEMEIFYRTRIRPLQNVFGGQLDAYFRERLGKTTDVEFESFDYSESSAEIVMKALQKMG